MHPMVWPKVTKFDTVTCGEDACLSGSVTPPRSNGCGPSVPNAPPPKNWGTWGPQDPYCMTQSNQIFHSDQTDKRKISYGVVHAKLLARKTPLSSESKNFWGTFSNVCLFVAANPLAKFGHINGIINTILWSSFQMWYKNWWLSSNTLYPRWSGKLH